MFPGVVAGLGAALCWTLASFLWRGLATSLGAAQLNLLKNALGLVLLLPVVLILWQPLPAEALALLALSGVLGIAAGDSLFFVALRRLGTRRTLTVEAAGPVLTTLAGVVLLGERPRVLQLVGLALVSAAVVLVARSAPQGLQLQVNSQGQRQGLVLLLLGLLCFSAGALITRHVLAGQAIGPWQSASVRLAAATVVQLPLLPGLLGRLASAGPRPVQRRWPLVILAALLGTTVGIGLQQTTLALLPAGEAVTLMATAPIMAVVMARWEGDRPGWPGVLAALLALLGVLLVAG